MSSLSTVVVSMSELLFLAMINMFFFVVVMLVTQTSLSEIRALLFNSCTSMVLKFMKLNMVIAPSGAVVSVCQGDSLVPHFTANSAGCSDGATGIVRVLELCSNLSNPNQPEKQKASLLDLGRDYHAQLAVVMQHPLKTSK